MQRIAVQWMPPPQRAAVLQRTALAARHDAVAVCARQGVVASVEALVRGHALHRGDLGREQRIEVGRVKRLAGIGDHLAPRVHAPVRAPGHRQQGLGAQDCLDRRLQLGLDRALAGLRGPAGEWAAVVFERELGDEGQRSVIRC